jgi:hypothetical protein
MRLRLRGAPCLSLLTVMSGDRTGDSDSLRNPAITCIPDCRLQIADCSMYMSVSR